ncbi:MAG: hypothetical protein ACI4GY_09205 [Acutalibacteraceae bacterium]
MKKKFKAAISLLLSLCIVLSCAAVSFAAGEADKTPVILIPGFGQSETKVYDDDGTYLGQINTFDLPGLDAKSILSALASPALKTVVSRKDKGLSKAVSDYMYELFKPFALNDDGTPVYNKVVTNFDKPYSLLPEEQQNTVYHHVSINGLSDYDDVRYYYAYDSFGSIKEAADGLHDYIHNVVLAQTGADKVCLVPISQGGTVLIEYLDLYPEDYKYIKKIINMIPAFDGSEIVGDVLLDHVTVYDIDALHDEVIPSLIEDKDTAYQISIAVQLALSESAQKDVLKAAIAAARDILVKNSSMMWALCPADDYKLASEQLISDEAHKAVKAETDRYDEARSNFKNNLTTLMDNGVIVHTIASYGVGYFLSSLFECSQHNADDLLNPSSPSLGATAADMGKTLPDDYVSPHTYCNNPSHNHISPDRVIDASTGFLPENTWYYKGISHMAMNSREDVKNFAARLIVDDSITDIYSCDGYTQFTDPLDNVGYTVEENSRTYYYDKDGNFMYSEVTKDSSDESQKDSVTFWSVLHSIFSYLRGVFRMLRTVLNSK